MGIEPVWTLPLEHEVMLGYVLCWLEADRLKKPLRLLLLPWDGEETAFIPFKICPTAIFPKQHDVLSSYRSELQPTLLL